MATDITRLTKMEWRCFFCGEVFHDISSARDHFGSLDASKAACLIKTGAEQSLLSAYRQLERQMNDLMADLHNENTEAARHYHEQQARHHASLQAAEELGYERGLRDARSEDSSSDGYSDAFYVSAFYQLANMLNMNASTGSPRVVWEKTMKPRIEALIAHWDTVNR